MLLAGGIFPRIRQAGLAECYEMRGSVREGQGIDGALGKAPLATRCVGRDPTDKGKKNANATCSPNAGDRDLRIMSCQSDRSARCRHRRDGVDRGEHFGFTKLIAECGQQVIELCDGASADEGGGHCGMPQHPAQREVVQ